MLLCLAFAAGNATAASDACLARVPKTLASLLRQKYPDYHLPLVRDGDKDESDLTPAWRVK